MSKTQPLDLDKSSGWGENNSKNLYVQTVYYKIGYEVATISRLPKNIGLFCKRALQNRRYSAKETYDFKEPTNRSHPIPNSLSKLTLQITTEFALGERGPKTKSR